MMIIIIIKLHVFLSALAKIKKTWIENCTDPVLSDYNLFWSLQSFHNGLHLVLIERYENHLSQAFFIYKPQVSYRDGVVALPEKWQKIMD